MVLKPKILWIVDGHGWGWDTRAKALSALLSEFTHVLVGYGEEKEQINEVISREKPDVVVCFAVTLVSYLVCDCKVITNLTGTRILEG